MTLTKKLAVVGIAALALGATACGSSGSTDTAASSSTTAAPTSTTEKESTTTTEEDDDSTTTKVTKPAKVEKIDEAELPESTRDLGTGLGFTEEEEDCVDTVIYEYTQDPSNATDDATLSGVVGGAVAACVDQDTIAAAIVDSIKEAAPEITTAQADCIESEIAAADTESLAIFLGAFIYEGPGAEEMQTPFIEALDQACELSA
jgi:hypothetical protein